MHEITPVNLRLQSVKLKCRSMVDQMLSTIHTFFAHGEHTNW